MLGGAVVHVPADWGEDLLAEGVGVRAHPTRGPGVNEFVTLVVQGADTTASFVSIIVAGHAVARFARALIARMRRTEKTTVSITVESEGRRTRSCTVDLSDDAAVDVLIAFLAEVDQ